MDDWNYLPDTTGLIIAQTIGNIVENYAPDVYPEIINKTLKEMAELFNERFNAGIAINESSVWLHEIVYKVCVAIGDHRRDELRKKLSDSLNNDTHAASSVHSGEGI